MANRRIFEEKYMQKRPIQQPQDDPGISVKLFHAKIDKYLDSHVFYYRRTISHAVNPPSKTYKFAPMASMDADRITVATPVEGGGPQVTLWLTPIVMQKLRPKQKIN